MTTRKRLEGALADWHPHPKDHGSLAPVVRDAGVADEIAERFFQSAPQPPTPEPPMVAEPAPRQVAIQSAAVRARRRYLMRYVAGAVTVAGIIGLAAVVRVTTARDASAAASPWRAYVAAASLPAAAPTDDPIAPADPRAGPAVEAPAAPGAVDPANPASDIQAAQDEATEPPAPADVSPRAAADAKRDSQRAIDRGQVSPAQSRRAKSLSRSTRPTQTHGSSWARPTR